MTTQPVAHAEGRFYERAAEGQLYHGQTAKTGVAPGTDIGTTAPLALYNPAGSDVDLVIVRASLAYVSGTLGAGFLSHCVNIDDDAAAVTGTAVTEVNAKTGAVDGVGRLLTTATLPAAPIPIRPFASLGASLASTAVAPWPLGEDIDGAIIITPGCAYSIQGVLAAGSTPLVVFGYSWYERPR